MNRLIRIFVLLWTVTIPVSALTLDWSTATWTGGSLSGTFDVDGDGTDDVSVSISGTTGALLSGYPANGTLFDGGGAGDNSLGLYVNFTSSSSTIVIEVNFLNMIGADNVVMTMLDIDANQIGSSSNYRYRDQLTGIYAVSGGTNVAPDISVASTSINTVSGSGTNQTVTSSGSPVSDTGGGSGNGNVTISYTQNITSATISFGNGSGVQGNNPDQQTFALFDISFTPRRLPETGTTIISLGACLTALLGRQFLRARRKRAEP